MSDPEWLVKQQQIGIGGQRSGDADELVAIRPRAHVEIYRQISPDRGPLDPAPPFITNLPIPRSVSSQK